MSHPAPALLVVVIVIVIAADGPPSLKENITPLPLMLKLWSESCVLWVISPDTWCVLVSEHNNRRRQEIIEKRVVP